MRSKGMHHVKFTKAIWNRWLRRLNATPPPSLVKGIEDFRSLLARQDDMRRNAE